MKNKWKSRNWLKSKQPKNNHEKTEASKTVKRVRIAVKLVPENHTDVVAVIKVISIKGLELHQREKIKSLSWCQKNKLLVLVLKKVLSSHHWHIVTYTLTMHMQAITLSSTLEIVPRMLTKSSTITHISAKSANVSWYPKCLHTQEKCQVYYTKKLNSNWAKEIQNT